jgi:hypothetical protein
MHDFHNIFFRNKITFVNSQGIRQEWFFRDSPCGHSVHLFGFFLIFPHLWQLVRWSKDWKGETYSPFIIITRIAKRWPKMRSKDGRSDILFQKLKFNLVSYGRVLHFFMHKKPWRQFKARIAKRWPQGLSIKGLSIKGIVKR